MFSKVFLVATLIGSTLASPLPLAQNDDTSLVRRTAQAPADDTCLVWDAPAFNNIHVFATKESVPIDQMCGKKYLDKFRGRCGVISNWECKFVDDKMEKVEHREENEDKVKGAFMTFKTSAFCFPEDVMAAMGAASARQGHKPSKCDTSPPIMIP